MNSAARTAPEARIHGITVARGMAALMVVLHHAASITGLERYAAVQAFEGGLVRFAASTSFFFVLSGFLIGTSYWSYFQSPRGGWNFLTKRLLRLYPVYWVVLIPLIILYQLNPSKGLPHQRELESVIQSILLIPGASPPILGVAWTLLHEVLFTFAFAAALLAGKAGAFLLAAWALLILAFDGVLRPDYGYLLAFLLSSANLQILLGLATARLMAGRKVAAPGTLTVSGLALYATCLFLGGLLINDLFWERMIYAAASCLLIAGIVGLKQRGSNRAPAALTRLGDISYSLYLTHPIAISLMSTVWYKFMDRTISPELVVILFTAACIPIAYAFHRLAEQPVDRAVARLRQSTVRS